MQNHKLKKYVYKFLESKDKENYRTKLKQYNSQVSMVGGYEHQTTDFLYLLIKESYNDQLLIPTDLPGLFPTDKTCEQTENSNLACFDENESKGEESYYKFKKNLSGITTDSFIKCITPETYTHIGLMLDKTMNYCIDRYIEIWNNDNKNTVKLTHDDIHFSLKGGNLIRILLTKLNNSLQNNLSKLNVNELSKQAEFMQNISGEKFGDFDMSLDINKEFSDEMYTKLEKDFMKIYLVNLYIIKNKLITFNIDDKEYTNNVASNMKDIQDMAKTWSITTKNIITPKYTINPDNSIKENNEIESKAVLKKSFMMKNRITNMNIKDIVYVSKLLVENPNNKTPMINLSEFTKIDTSFVSLSDVNLYTLLGDTIKFTMSRLKINNIYNGVDKNNNPVQLSIPCELFDCVITKKNDVNSKLIIDILDFLKKDKYKVYTLGDYKINMYSEYNLWIDISIIVFVIGIYPWQNPKYVKRAKRQILLSLYCSLSDNGNDYQHVIDLLQADKELYKSMILSSNIDEIYKIILTLLDSRPDFYTNKYGTYNGDNINYFAWARQNIFRSILFLHFFKYNKIEISNYEIKKDLEENIKKLYNVSPPVGSISLIDDISYYKNNIDSDVEQLQSYIKTVIYQYDLIIDLLKIYINNNIEIELNNIIYGTL